jgi:8-oxo-dGTP pyrophosphatase MutT (NUDIX family)
MDAWVIVLIVIGAGILLAALVVIGRRARERQLEQKRAEAAGLRSEAGETMQRAQEREETARREASQAAADREMAQEQARRADEVDPDADR